MNYLAVAIQPIHLESISTIQLTKLIRDETEKRGKGHSMSLSQALTVAYALKEAHRVGVIRGQVLK
jgi:hypothetical protein